MPILNKMGSTFVKWLFFSLFPLSFFAAECVVDLRNPSFKNGVLSTREGGVIKSSDIRIQAQNIQYTYRVDEDQTVQKIEAEGNLLIQYKEAIFVGRQIEFDFQKNVGTILDGKTFAEMWYLGGEEIQLHADGSFHIKNAFITACENKESSWDLRASSVEMQKNQFLEAKAIRFRFFNYSTFAFPSIRLGLKKVKRPLFGYYVNWNKGPKLGIRWQLYSWRDFTLYGRCEYRWTKGWGGALETEYYPDDKLTTFVTRSYLGTDRLFNAEDVERRYRLQGALSSRSKNDKTLITLSWDKYSDVRMPGDFKSEDFEVDTALRTLFYINHREKSIISSFKCRPRVNSFETIKQDLPSLYAITRPLPIKNSGIISSNYIRASYLSFEYSDQLVAHLKDFRSPRVELFEHLYRPFHLGPLTLTPHVAARGIFYGNSPSHNPKTLGLLDYGAKAHFHGLKQFSSYKHIFEPYLQYKALSRPNVSANDHYIFSIQDGFEKLQQIEMGAHNLFLSPTSKFIADLYANAFFSDPTIPQLIPRLYLFLGLELPSIHFWLHSCYNFRHQIPDFSNARLKWTLNENVAMSLEARYRSKYDWRKADHTNFILDVSRKERELLESPLSDRRVTLLSNIFIRLTPFWEMKLESHHGFYRLYKNHIKEEPYNEFRIHLYTWINSAWKLQFYYGYTLNNHSDWTFNFNLVRKPF